MRWTLLLVVWLGCYAPQPHPGAPCLDGRCPDGLVCAPATQTCEREADASDAAVDATAAADAAADAATIDAAPTAPMLIQQVGNYGVGIDSLSATLASPPTSGHVLVMMGGDPAQGLTTVTGGGATWTVAARSLTHGNVEIWFGISDGSSSTVTIALPGTSSAMTMVVSEWAGLVPTADLLDTAQSASGVVSPASPGAIVTSGRDLLLFAVSDGGNTVFGAPTPGTWTAMLGIAHGSVQLAWYRVLDTVGAVTPEVSETAGTWDAAVAALRVAN